MFEEVYVIEKSVQARERELVKYEPANADADLAGTNPFYCKLPLAKRLDACNCG